MSASTVELHLLTRCPVCKDKGYEVILRCRTCLGCGEIPTAMGREMLALFEFFSEPNRTKRLREQEYLPNLKPAPASAKDGE